MKLDRVKYTRYFKETEEWLGAEIQVEEGDYEPDVWQAAIWSVEAAYNKKWGHYNTGPDNRIHPIPSQTEIIRDIVVDKTPPEERIKAIADGIGKCTTLEGGDGLLSFKGLVEREGNKWLTEAYDTMYQKLSK